MIINVPIFNMDQEENNESLLSRWFKRKQLLEVRDYFLFFLKNPIEGIKTIPDWTWPLIALVASALAIVSSTLSGVLSGKILFMFLGLTAAPILFCIMCAIIAGFFYYTFYFFFNRELDYKSLCTLVVISSTPTLAVNLFSFFIPPVTLLGFAASCFLIIVGLVEHFQMPRKPISRLIAIIFTLYAAKWVFELVDFSQKEKLYKSPITKENIDTLERELKGK